MKEWAQLNDVQRLAAIIVVGRIKGVPEAEVFLNGVAGHES